MDPEYQALLAYAARIGSDPALVQGAGGNVSLKRDGVLWVKASGTWLMHAIERDIMVPVSLDKLLRAVHDDDAEAMEAAHQFVPAWAETTLRPSIETTMHGLLPHRIVVHVHCVETIARAIRGDAEAVVAPLLAGLRWGFVPYVRPGAPLARAIAAVLEPGMDVLVLGNHGLVVGAETTAEAAALLADVSRRLRVEPRVAPAPDLAGLLAERMRPAEPATHGLATDPASLAVARRGPLYPDHVIFLGPGVSEVPSRWPMLVVAGAGVLMADDASPGAHALARCLADVTARVVPDAPLRVLTRAEEAELLGWDAEQYRQSLDAG